MRKTDVFVDASAIVAVIAREPGHERLAARMKAASSRTTSPLAVFEAALALARKADEKVSLMRSRLDTMLASLDIAVVEIPASLGKEAVTAFERYGKGRHPARLNMGDCFAYAMARHLDVPLLYEGDDFARTDMA